MTPDEYTIQETFLEVGDGHTLYIQDWGNPKAKTPIIFLHGGPGSGCRDVYKQYFEPTTQRVIFFDQRGAGKSLPYGSLEHNTTAELVEDIEKISRHFNLNTFTLVGGSWGSCLAFAYALKYPDKVHAMVLRGLFTSSERETDWLNKGGWRNFFPDLWDRYLALTPKSHHDDPTAYHTEHAFGNDPQAAKTGAYAYDSVESALLRLDDRFTPESFDTFDSARVRLELHYLTQLCFMPDRYILNNAHKLTMPVWLVQGRYDFVCPPKTAYELHQKLSNSQLVWTVSGHSPEREGWNVIRTILLQLAGGK